MNVSKPFCLSSETAISYNSIFVNTPYWRRNEHKSIRISLKVKLGKCV